MAGTRLGRSSRDTSRRSRLKVVAVGLFLLAALAVGQPDAAVKPDTLESLAGPVTNVFFEADLVQSLRDISAQAKVQIVTDGSVSGTVTAELVNLSVEAALARLLYPLGFAFKKVDDYYLVGGISPESPSFYLLAESKNVTPGYLKADEAFKLMPEQYQKYLKVVPESNTLVITAPAVVLRSIEEGLSAIDKPKPQVLIEALVTEISGEGARSFGVDWSGVLMKGGDTLMRAGANMSNLLDSGLTFAVKQLTGRLGSLSYDLVPTIQALVKDGKAHIKANPRVVTAEGQPAEISVGQERYYQMLSGSGPYPYYRLEKIEVGVSLTITPYVADNGDITLVAEPVVSDVVGQGMDALPIVSKRQAKTKVVVKDGEEVVIGGLTLSNEHLVQTRIPFLGSIPIIGFLFSNTRKVTAMSEVVIVIIPHLLKQGGGE
jgi:type II secretory pathway component GspD/PulD (secretin)